MVTMCAAARTAAAAAAAALLCTALAARALCPVGSLPAMAPFFASSSVAMPQFVEPLPNGAVSTSHYCVCAADNTLHTAIGYASPCAQRNGTNEAKNVCARGETVTDFGCWCWDAGSCWTFSKPPYGQYPGCLGQCGCPPDSVPGAPDVGGCVCANTGAIRSHHGCRPYLCPRGKVLNYWPRAFPRKYGNYEPTDHKKCVCNDLFRRSDMATTCGHKGDGAPLAAADDWDRADHCPKMAGNTCNCDGCASPYGSCWTRESPNGGCACNDGFFLTGGPGAVREGDQRGMCQGLSGTQPHSCTNGGNANMVDCCSCTADGCKGEYYCVASFTRCSWGTRVKLPHCRTMPNQPAACPPGTVLNPYMGCQACYGFGSCPDSCPPNSFNGTLPAHQNLCWCEHGPEANSTDLRALLPAAAGARNCPGAPPTAPPTARPTLSPVITPPPVPIDTAGLPAFVPRETREPTPPPTPQPVVTQPQGTLAPTTTTTALPTPALGGDGSTQPLDPGGVGAPTVPPVPTSPPGPGSSVGVEPFAVGGAGFIASIAVGGVVALLVVGVVVAAVVCVVRSKRRKTAALRTHEMAAAPAGAAAATAHDPYGRSSGQYATSTPYYSEQHAGGQYGTQQQQQYDTQQYDTQQYDTQQYDTQQQQQQYDPRYSTYDNNAAWQDHQQQQQQQQQQQGYYGGQTTQQW